jgi:hypothetical protein
VHEDSYEEGELQSVHSWSSSDFEDNNKTFSAKNELMYFIKEVVKRDTDYKPITAEEFEIQTYKGGATIWTDVLCKYIDLDRGYDRYEKATDDEIEQWKRGELKLFNVSFSFKVEVYEPRKRAEFDRGGATDADYWKENKGDFAGWIEVDESEVDDDYIDRHFAKGGKAMMMRNNYIAPAGSFEEFDYLYLVERDGGLLIEPTDKGYEAYEGGDLEMHDLFEDIQANSDTMYFEDGSEILGLSEAPIITRGYYYDDDGEIVDGGEGEVYYFPNYMTQDVFESVISSEGALFKKVDNYAKGGKTKDYSYDYADIGQFSMNREAWSDFTDKQFEKIGRDIVEVDYDGNIEKAYESIVRQKFEGSYAKGGKMIDGISYAEKGRWSVKSQREEGYGNPQPYTTAVAEMNEKWIKERNEDKTKIVKEGNEWVLYVNEDYKKGGEVDMPLYRLSVVDDSGRESYDNSSKSKSDAEKIFNEYKSDGIEVALEKRVGKKDNYEYETIKSFDPEDDDFAKGGYVVSVFKNRDWVDVWRGNDENEAYEKFIDIRSENIKENDVALFNDEVGGYEEIDMYDSEQDRLEDD